MRQSSLPGRQVIFREAFGKSGRGSAGPGRSFSVAARSAQCCLLFVVFSFFLFCYFLFFYSFFLRCSYAALYYLLWARVLWLEGGVVELHGDLRLDDFLFLLVRGEDG